MATIGTIYWKLTDGELKLQGTSFEGSSMYVQPDTISNPPWYEFNSTITTVRISNTIIPKYITNFFRGCVNLTVLIDSIDPETERYSLVVSEVADAKYAYFDCCKLPIKNHLLGSARFEKCKKFDYMFALNSGVTSTEDGMTLTSMQTPVATSFKGMFQNRQAVEAIAINNLDTSNVTDFSSMFSYCLKLEGVTLSYFDVKNGRDFSYMFYGCSSLGQVGQFYFDVDFSTWDVSKGENFSNMFRGVTGSNETLISELEKTYKWDFSSAVDMSYMFTQTKIRRFEIKNKVLNNLQNMNNILSVCPNLVSVFINAKIPNLTNTNMMFYNCSNLNTIYAKNSFGANSLSVNTLMFFGCTSLVGGNGTTYNASNVDGRYAIIDGQMPGYFTAPLWTVRLLTSEGNGTITSNVPDYPRGSKEGTIVNIVATANKEQYSYLEHLYKYDEDDELLEYGVDVLQEKTSGTYTYTYKLDGDYKFKAVFGTRTLHTITINESQYEVTGAGEYRYLDKVTLYANLSQGLINIKGWESNGTILSRNNPYVFRMPDNDLTLNFITEGEVFDDLPFRQQLLQNNNGEIYKLTDKNNNIFFDEPTGFGYEEELETEERGNSLKVKNEKPKMPVFTGDMLFYDEDNRDIYDMYNSFIKFLSAKPITLWQKIPTKTLGVDTYHIPVNVIQVEKTQRSKDMVMHCPIEMRASKLWRASSVVLNETSDAITVTNNGFYESGFDLYVEKADNSSFSNPKIQLLQNNEVYGEIALNCTNVVAIEINTNNNENDVVIYDGISEVNDSFEYIDFTKANGIKSFPFPKLKTGTTTIRFTYDNSGSEDKTYYMMYDEEYLSV